MTDHGQAIWHRRCGRATLQRVLDTTVDDGVPVERWRVRLAGGHVRDVPAAGWRRLRRHPHERRA